ncbi:MAG TPA: VIT domain-containing protein [Verrucomicrobiota bacterium]|nr:VIT domain-containing protein [Verrucomicrobiota bacterium]HQL79147.1 VIT domain-containing protein [Verrucomicrobiota bacterium]
MSQWTETAKAKLEQYLAQMGKSLAGSGADANEVVEDLRRHVEEEAAARKLTVVTEQDLAQILARIGTPEAIALPGNESPAPPPPANRPKGGLLWKVGAGVLLIFGVLLPLGTVVFEFLTGACAGVLFDPIPTLAHAALVALVPLVNLAVWVAVCRGERRWRTALGWASGFTIGVALVYALLFLPATPFAVIGILFLGFGFVPLAPLASLICALILRNRLRGIGGEATPLPGLWRGLALAVVVLGVLALPMIITKVGLQMAASDSSTESTRGIRWLRDWGQNEELLRACYGRAGRSGGLYSWGKRVNPETARMIYYRVNGCAFNSIAPPKLYAGRVRWNLMEEEFTWDDDQAGDAVAGRVRGLSLASSRQDGIIYPDAALAYLEWTLEFKNDSRLQREARAQILLPPGAVVSRLTLWIDGEERDAAFGGRSQVKTAYKEVVQKQRDPVLVTTCGPDRVLVQCFPVSPDGGRMKLRLGITAPLSLTAPDAGCLRWPCFAERNFTIGDQLHHSLWVESSQPLETAGGKLTADQAKPGVYALRGQLRDGDLFAPINSVCARRPAEIASTWTRTTHEPENQIIRQTIVARPPTISDRVILVLDMTKGMEACLPAIQAALSALPADIEFALLLARDGYEEALPVQRVTPELAGKAAQWKFRTAGGQDNVPALIRAWELAAQTKAGVILWVHGPQPMLLDSAGELRQRFERSPNPPLLLDAQTQPGPNRILEMLDGLKPVRSIIRYGSLGDDLTRLFSGWSNRTGTVECVRERIGPDFKDTQTLGTETSTHLARLWAAEEVERLCAARHLSEATQLAARYQLVTPVSGAVVLETTAQYERAGLQPASPESVPIVPEPSGGMLLLLGLMLLAARRHK